MTEETLIDLDAAQARLARMGMDGTVKLDIRRGDSGHAHDKGISEGQYEAAVASMRPDDAFRAVHSAENDTTRSTLGTCPECRKGAVFQGRNRLANCGHVRRSHGKLVPRDKKPTPAEQPAQGAGGLTQEQRQMLDRYVGAMVTARENLHRAIDAHDKAQQNYEHYLDSLVKGGKP